VDLAQIGDDRSMSVAVSVSAASSRIVTSRRTSTRVLTSGSTELARSLTGTLWPQEQVAATSSIWSSCSGHHQGWIQS
jgi:hypothetical protein